MADIELGCRATMIGSMPHTDPDAACKTVFHYLKDIPAWPQLPKRSYLESMYVQFSEGLPGGIIENGTLSVDRSKPFDKAVEDLYTAYIDNKPEPPYHVERSYAAGLYKFLETPGLSPVAVKGQVTGPISFGLTIQDSNKQPIIYDYTFSDLVPKLIRLKAMWMEQQLRQMHRRTIVFIDEPYMTSYGSAYVTIMKEMVVNALNEVFSGLTGIKGVHCCGNTDWPVLLGTNTDILSFDAYNLYPAEVKAFLDRGGNIAWGIVPVMEEELAKETAASLKDRLEEAIAPFTRKGIHFNQLIVQGLLTPACGLATLSNEDSAARALELLSDLSKTIRQRYL
jgi:methionine synthase II (cobalamin-independent)